MITLEADTDDDQAANKDNFDENKEDKAFLNAPSWSEELCAQISKANNWTIIANKLKFKKDDIETWSFDENPAELMLKEWFLSNKKLEATAGLKEVFKDLNLFEYVKLIERYTKKIERLSRENSYDEELDAPDVFISFEKSSLEEAKILKSYLARLNIEIWIDDGRIPGETSRVQSSSSRNSR